MCNVNKGRLNGCANNIGGINAIYIFNFVDYRKFQIETNGNTLVQYPPTNVFKYDLREDANTFSVDVEDSDTGRSYNQNATFVLKVLRKDAHEINALINKRIGCIVVNRLGQIQIMGLYNGVIVKSVKGTTGGSRNSFNGYNIELSAKETTTPFYIDDLEDTGFIPMIPTVDNYLLQEDGAFLLQEDNFKIIL